MKKIKQFLSKVTGFDLILIAVLIILALFFFFFFNRKTKYIKIRVKVTDQEILYARTQPDSWYANQFQIGDVERDALGKIVTEIVGVEKYNISDGQKVIYLDLEVKALYDSRTRLYSARGKPLLVGTPIRFDFSYVIFNGIVTKIPDSKQQNNFAIKKTRVKALLRGFIPQNQPIEPKILESLKEGDKIFDSNGNTLVEMLEIEIVPAERVTQTDSGELLLKQDPFYKDVYFILDIRAQFLNGEAYIFDNLPLKIGITVPLNFPYLSLSPIIIAIGNQ